MVTEQLEVLCTRPRWAHGKGSPVIWRRSEVMAQGDSYQLRGLLVPLPVRVSIPQAALLILPVLTCWPLTDREKPDRKPHRFWWLWNLSTRKSGQTT